MIFQDKFQKCCGERKLYFKGECYTPLSQGPCKDGEWLIMEKGGDEGVCKKTPCESPIQVSLICLKPEQRHINILQFLKNGECIFGVDLTKRGLLCSLDKRPWYSVYGDWECQVSKQY